MGGDIVADVATLREKVDGLAGRLERVCAENTREHEALRADVMALVSAELAGIRTAVTGLGRQFETTIAQQWKLIFGLVVVLAGLAFAAWGVTQVPKIF